MADRHDLETPDARVLTHVLEKMRARNGLSAARLQNSRDDDAAPLLGLAATHRYATVHDVTLHDAALAVVAECIKETVDGTHRIVADPSPAPTLRSRSGVFSGKVRQRSIPVISIWRNRIILCCSNRSNSVIICASIRMLCRNMGS